MLEKTNEGPPPTEFGPTAAPAAREAPPNPAPVNNAPPGADEAPVGQPGALLPAPCARCSAEVPAGAERCPACGVFQPGNIGALVHGLRSKKLAAKVDAYRVDLLDQLFKERGGREALDVVSRIAIENYALVCAQHKTIESRLDQDGLFTQTGRRRSAFDMLKTISETIDRLRAELPPTITRTSTFAGVDAMPSSALRLASDLLRRQLAGETLSERELGQLDMLRHATRGHVVLPPDPLDVADIPAYRDKVDAEIVELGATSRPVSESEASQPAPEPTCGYGCGTLTRCVEIKKTRPDAWRALHYTDPEEVARRNKEATAVMMARVGKPHPWAY